MKLAIIGVGKMGGAILEGALAAHTLRADEVGIADISAARVDELTAKYGVTPLGFGDIQHAQYCLIAVKPQSFAELAPNLKGKCDTYMSIMAGVDIATISAGVDSDRVIRLMPNLGAAVQQSATALTASKGTTAEDTTFASMLFSAIGKVFPMSENLINAFTGLAGSGPSFVAVFAEALADGGVRCGFPRELARELAQQVLFGSALLLADKPPATLKDEVCSAAGTSIAGVRALEEHGLRFAAMQAVEEATARAHALSQNS